VLEGGTHNPLAPPFEFLRDAFAPLLARAGAGLALELERPGFHPAGGGRLRAVVTPAAEPRPLELLERGAERARRAEIALAHLPREIAEREWSVLARELPGLARVDRELASSVGPGNCISIHLEFEHATEVVTAFGERRLGAERVAQRAASEARRYLGASAPVGEHLADQLMLPLALLAGGRYRTVEPSLHARTNAEIIGLFLPGAVRLEPDGRGGWLVSVTGLRAP
jgi:RNA 3'-terminal phosphate cyclase (ATP)